MRKIYYFLIKCYNSIKCICSPYIFTGQYTTNRNFGDALGIWIPKLMGINNGNILPKRYVFDWVYRRTANLQMVGSTLGDVDENSILCGAGAVSASQSILCKPRKIISVRGPLTRQLILNQGVDCPEVYGDPAMLLPLFYNPRISNKKSSLSEDMRIGVIPHYVDKDNIILRELLNLPQYELIDILCPLNGLGKLSIEFHWKSWIDNLCSYDAIISSSLHGLIIAEAYGIPTLWVKFSDDINGNDFKFYDYYASINEEVSPIDLRITSLNSEFLKEKFSYKDTSVVNKCSYLKMIKNVLEEELSQCFF